MDVQLQELIDKIKKDGIESASAEAARVRKEADAEAKRIVDAARKEAAAILAQGKADAERAEKAGVAAVAQASRNLVLSFGGEIQGLLDALVQKNVEKVYSDDILKVLLPDLIKNWVAKDSNSMAVLLPADALDRMEGFFRSALAAELKKGVELRSDRRLSGGFRISNKDGSAYYDFSSHAVAELMSAYLNPRLADNLKNALKES